MTTDKKQAILRSAERLFSTKGFDQTTVADIAKKTGIHEASLYSYFNGKKIILFELVGEYLQNAIKTLKEHFLGMVEAGPKLRKSIWHFLADMDTTANPDRARILMMVQKENPEFYASTYFRYMDEYMKLLVETIKAGQEEGLFKTEVSPRLIRNMTVGTSLFTAYGQILHGYSYDPHEASDVIYRLVVNAFGPRVSPPADEAFPRGRRPKKDRSAARREHILEISTKVFARNGFSASTISEIAKHASMGDATLYGYFENKEAILMAIPEFHMKDLLSDHDFFSNAQTGAEGKLRKLIWRWVWKLWTEEDFARVLVLELLRNEHFYSSKGYGFFEQFLKEIEKVVHEGEREGIFIREVPFPTYIYMTIGTIDQFLLPQFLLNRPAPGLAELCAIVDSLVDAIKVK
ncbi:MAG: TetR family transcriptional regulator [Deltaproteobacteria bacterium]|nr:TetR family transcriptional regulator [Deltaproteobacteria bacterium]